MWDISFNETAAQGVAAPHLSNYHGPIRPGFLPMIQNKNTKKNSPARAPKRAQRVKTRNDPRAIMRKRKPRTTNFSLAPMTSGSQTGTKNSIRSRMPRRLGATLEGSLWALRALHPCDDAQGGGLPVPDLSQTNSANCESRHLTTITGPAGAPLWDLQILVLPFSDAVCAYRKKASTTTEWSYWHLIDQSKGTIKPGRNAFSETVRPMNVVDLPTLTKDATAFRQTFKGLTIEPNMASFTNQGMVTAGQWGLDVDVEDFKGEFSVTDLPANAIKHAIVKGIPTTKTDVLGACPNAGDWPAKHGIYMPMRFTQPTHLYQESTGTELQDTSVNPPTTWVSGMPILLYDVNSADTQIAVPYAAQLIWDESASYGPTGSFYTTSGSINQNVGTCIFTGVDTSTTFDIKTRTGIEFVAVADTTMAAFMAQAPLKDQVALDVVQATQTRLPVVYYSKYNSLGMILPLIARAAATILPTVLPHLINWLSPAKATSAPITLPHPDRRRAKYAEEDVD
jgi:hypothetical protein